jgi:hypothetical protein
VGHRPDDGQGVRDLFAGFAKDSARGPIMDRNTCLTPFRKNSSSLASRVFGHSPAARPNEVCHALWSRSEDSDSTMVGREHQGVDFSVLLMEIARNSGSSPGLKTWPSAMDSKRDSPGKSGVGGEPSSNLRDVTPLEAREREFVFARLP